MDLQPHLENNLITIRPLQIHDKEALYQVAKDPLIWEQHPVWDRYKREKFEHFFGDSLASKGALIVEEKKSSDVIGSSRFKRIEGAPHAIEIGWSFLARAYWGGKYNQAVKKAMITYAFQHVEEVIFYVHKTNIRSQKAVEKLGAKLLGPDLNNPCIRQNSAEWTYTLRKEDFT